MAKIPKNRKVLTIQDLKTPEDRKTFIEEMLKGASEEEIQSALWFSHVFLYVAAIMTGREDLIKDNPDFPKLPQNAKRLPEFIDLLRQDEELCNLSLSDFIKNERFKELAVSFFSQETPKKNDNLPPPLPKVIKYGLMNDLSSWELVRSEGAKGNNDLDGQLSLWWEIDRKKGNLSFPVYVSLLYSGDNVEISRKFTAFDEEVINAISTIHFYWEYLNGKIPLQVTPTQIWRIMNGKQLNDTSAKPTKGQLDRVCKSLDKMRFTKITIDFLQELKEFGYEIDDSRFSEKGAEDYLVNARIIPKLLPNGKVSTVYEILCEPLLFTYNRMKRRVLYVPLNLLDTSSETSNSENILEFRSYLLHRIKNMISGPTTINRILLETIYRDTGITPPGKRLDRNNFSSNASYSTKVRQEAKKDREKIASILSAWVEKAFITGFTPVKKSGAIVGFDISYVRKKTEKIEEKKDK